MPFRDPEDDSLADPLPAGPQDILSRWLEEAREDRVQRNPTAMTLATVEPDGRPSARVLLCRGFDPETVSIVFYTNSRSAKGRALAAHPYASAVFHWDALQRQARLAGPVRPVPDADSDAYFAGRPRLARIAARASAQSEAVASRAALLERLHAEEARLERREEVPRPAHWHGYRLTAERVELWVGADGRAHDRALWTRPDRAGAWTVARLQP